MSVHYGEREEARTNLKVAFIGLGAGLAWLLLVSAFAYWLAI